MLGLNGQASLTCTAHTSALGQPWHRLYVNHFLWASQTRMCRPYTSLL